VSLSLLKVAPELAEGYINALLVLAVLLNLVQ